MSFEEGRSGVRPYLFQDQEMDFQLMRTLATMSEGGAEIGEILQVVQNTEDGNIYSFASAWSEIAGIVEHIAKQQEKNRRSGGFLYLRAASYYRSAMGILSPKHPDHQRYWEQSYIMFEKACDLLDEPFVKLDVSYKEGILPCYLFTPQSEKSSNPTLIVATGGEGTAMEMYLWIGRECLRRGYNVLLFEGPHNPGANYLSGLSMEEPEDCEKSVSSAINQLEAIDQINPKKIAITGYSFGGFVAIRAAANDNRIQALIPNSPLRSLHDLLRTVLTEEVQQLPPEKLDQMMSDGEKAIIDVAMRSFGAQTLHELMTKLDHFRVNGLEEKIECPTLSLTGEEDGEEIINQAQQFHVNISSSKKLLKVFSVKEGAAAHCQVNNLSRMRQVTFEFLDDVFK
ncbi:alpha/beta hydrolase family protein [Oceanobacillus neutriphilus]|uniref:Peptidase S9 n=1 Tax=Oceanobacillus neutriphilus TaxID=531815 RepID=A0ABQ2NU62_9BACI|nr:alpha/beta hydrolase [Oceanobacillus neutriphilus]GGP10597.1 peptidase S9 [Oceanobacillus neutriphilus]